jgi:ATP-dependent Clp protease, protease subunit
MRKNFIIRNESTAPAAEINIIGEIGESWWSEESNTFDRVYKEIKSIGNKPININIMSMGGDLFEALAIHDVLMQHPASVTTNILGATASAGTVIGMAGEKRMISENSLFLAHESSIGTYGKIEDHEKAIELLRVANDRLVSLYKSKVSMTEDEIRNLMAEDRFISAQEALSYGFVTEITGKSKIENNYKELSKLLNLKSEKMDFTKMLDELKAFVTETFKASKPENDGYKVEIENKIKGFETELQNAVEINKTLSDQIAKIEAEKTQLQNEKSELETKIAQMEAGGEAKTGEEHNPTGEKSEEDKALEAAYDQIMSSPIAQARLEQVKAKKTTK